MSTTQPVAQSVEPFRLKTTPHEAGPAAGPTESYWIGIMPGTMYGNTPVGGVTFHSETFKWDESTPSEPKQIPMKGQVVNLTKGQVDAITDALVIGKGTAKGKPRRVMRFIGGSRHGKRRSQIVLCDGSYRPQQANDEPLTKWLYMMKVPGGMIPVGDPVPIEEG